MSWSKWHEACVDCGTTERRYAAHGLCTACYSRWSRAGKLTTFKNRWSAVADACLDCGGRERKHVAHGLCKSCYERRYRKVKGEIYRRTARVSRDRKFGIETQIPMGYEGLVFDVFGRRCALCGNDLNLVLDHHRPVQDGCSLLHNAVPLCRRCNAQKGIKAPQDFYDAWKFAEIAVQIWETREEFHHRFGEEVSP